MPKRTSDHGKHNRAPLLGGLKDSMNALAADLGLSKPEEARYESVRRCLAGDQ